MNALNQMKHFYEVFTSEDVTKWDIAKTLDPTGVLGIGEIVATASGNTDASEDEVAYARGQAGGLILSIVLTRKGVKGGAIPRGPGAKGSKPVKPEKSWKDKIFGKAQKQERIRGMKSQALE